MLNEKTHVKRESVDERERRAQSSLEAYPHSKCGRLRGPIADKLQLLRRAHSVRSPDDQKEALRNTERRLSKVATTLLVVQDTICAQIESSIWKILKKF